MSDPYDRFADALRTHWGREAWQRAIANWANWRTSWAMLVAWTVIYWGVQWLEANA